MNEDEVIYNTVKEAKALLKYEDLPDAVQKLHDEVYNYDEFLINEINKQVASIKHNKIEPNYSKIIRSIHKRYKYKLDLYLQIFLILMQGKFKLDNMVD